MLLSRLAGALVVIAVTVMSLNVVLHEDTQAHSSEELAIAAEYPKSTAQLVRLAMAGGFPPASSERTANGNAWAKGKDKKGGPNATTTTSVSATTAPTVAASSTTSLATTTSTAAATTTTKAAVTTTSAATLAGVVVAPGVDIQSLVSSHPAGTVFVIKAGVHRRQRVVPKDGMVFVGEPGAVLDGERVVDRAFSGGASNVTLQGLIIENYVPGAQQSAVGQAGNNWIVRDNEIRLISGIGLHAGQGSGWLVEDNYIHHNGQLGVASQGRNMVFVGNTIAFNNTEGYDARWEAGGGKFLHTTGLVLRDNHVHDNKGPGLWTDSNNVDCLYEGNLVERNTHEGIFHEISYDCVIRNNTVRDNAKTGIWIAGSSNVEVVGNVVTNNLQGGISGSQDPRGSGTLGTYEIRNLNVHHNTITQLKVPSDSFWGWSGIQQQTNDPSIFTSKGNLFHDNTWVVASGIAKPFKWADQRVTWDQWRNYGHDTTGTFTYR